MSKMDHQYSYLLLGLLFAACWLFLYWRMKNSRRELLLLSCIFAIAGVAADYLYIKDWWQPTSVIGVAPFTGEALLAAFAIAGVGAVLPEYILRLRYVRPKQFFTQAKMQTLLLSLCSMAVLFYGSFYFLKVNSLIATTIAFAVPSAFMLASRRDLLPVALFNGLLLVFLAAVVYGILAYFTPGWIEAFYLFQNTPPFMLITLPFDDAIFYFFAGLYFGTFYEWWQGLRRVSLTTAKTD